ncbi:MAG: hypothetical protein IPJ65_07180 [Archangiaceae bacterium]|nr:hypothetical protein [Archangiaceae bacterium]
MLRALVAELLHRPDAGEGVLPEHNALKEPASSLTTGICGAVISGEPCRSPAAPGRALCPRHGGNATGPRTPEGKRSLGDAVRRHYVEARLAQGWLLPTEAQRVAVRALKQRLNGSHNATAAALKLSRHGVRRVLAGLPLRPDESSLLERWLGAAGARRNP